MKNILMIAAEYPPCLSAGVQRTHHFVENLNNCGWRPHVLSAHPRIYKSIDHGIVVSTEIKSDVRRAFAVDVSKHLAVKGKYLGWLENPDRFASWFFMGWRKGLKMIRVNHINMIWSTYPVSTAHWIGLKLKLKTGLPWVADFRDPMHAHVDKTAVIPKKAKIIDRMTVKHADALVFATEKMKQLYQRAYPDVNTNKFYVIENGYDESLFDHLKRTRVVDGVFKLLYSGALYPYGRDPKPLFLALSNLQNAGKISSDSFRLIFRGAGNGFEYQELLKQLSLDKIVEFLGAVTFSESIQEMKDSDGLLVLQGEMFNNQIPGKVYEYIATGNPILGLVGEGGATEGLLLSRSNAFVSEERDVSHIENNIISIIKCSKVIDVKDTIYSRKARSMLLVDLLDNILR